jgi:hypothetical protein
VGSREARSELLSPQVQVSQEPLRLQEEPQPQVPPWALPFQLQPLAPQVPQASVAQPEAPQVPQQPDAYAPLLLQHPSLPCPPWPLLLPPLQRPLLPGDACAPSPQHPREWSWSASSFP